MPRAFLRSSASIMLLMAFTLEAAPDPKHVGRLSRPATEPPQGVLPHCPSGDAPAFLPVKQEVSVPALLAVVASAPGQSRDVDHGGRACCFDRWSDRLIVIGTLTGGGGLRLLIFAACGHLSRRSSAPLMGTNRLLLLIAALALLVALGILTG